jgi:hypothetical protein
MVRLHTYQSSPHTFFVKCKYFINVRGHPLRSAIFLRDPDFGSAPERPHQVSKNTAGSPLHRTGRGFPQASLFLKDRYPSPGLLEGIFLKAAKRLRSQTVAMPSNNQHELILSDSIQSMEELLRKSKKLKCGATLEKADIDGARLPAYARISWRCRVLCVAKNENAVDIICRRFACYFLRESRI